MPAPDYAVEISQLEDALSNGELEIRSADGSRTIFQSAADIEKRLMYFKREAKGVSSATSSRTTYATFGRLCD